MLTSPELAAQLVSIAKAYDGAVDLSSLVAVEPGGFDVEGFVRHWGERRTAGVRGLVAALERHREVPEVAEACAAISDASPTFERALKALARYRDLTPAETVAAVDTMSQAYCAIEAAVERAAMALQIDQASLDKRLSIRGHLLSYLHGLAANLERHRGAAISVGTRVDATRASASCSDATRPET